MNAEQHIPIFVGSTNKMSYFFRSKALSNTKFIATESDIYKIIDINRRDAESVIKITKTPEDKEFLSKLTCRNALYHSFRKDKHTDGFVTEYPYGRVILQGERGHYYRGEGQVYPKSHATVYRRFEDFSPREQILYGIIARMRIYCFGEWLFQFDHVRRWYTDYSDVLSDALGQHYGFETELLDITNDFDTALFFACWQYDEATDSWIPRFKSVDSQSENLQYGVIFHIPAWKVAMQSLSPVPYQFCPVGYQPFQRCHMQHSYVLNTQYGYDLQNDIQFEKIHFKHSEKIAMMIFEKMKCGKEIYPTEGLLFLKEQINSLQKRTVFPEEAFNHTIEEFALSQDAEAIKRELEHGTMKIPLIKIIAEAEYPSVSAEDKEHINQIYRDFSLQKNYGIPLVTRFSC